MSATLHFERSEYDMRITCTRKAMADSGVELLIASDPSNMAWLTGYDGWSFYTHQAVLLTMDGEPVWWGRGMDARGAERTVFMEKDNIVGYEDIYIQNPERHPMLTLADLIRERGWAQLTMAVEMDNYYFSAAAFKSLQESFPDKTIHDATGLVNWQRAVKSEREILFMRRAARIVEEMHREIVERVEPGLPKNKLVAEIYATSVRGADGHWGDYSAFVPMLPSGMDATAPHLTWDDRPFVNGECTFFEIGGAYRRYQCPQSRSVFLGNPPQKYLDAEKAVLEAVDAGLEQAKPGNTCEDIAIAFNSTLNKLGFEKDSRAGYAIGLSYPPDWGERTMSFRHGDKTVLRPGMTFHFMPALWLDDGGLEITEPILITDSGVECLCNTPRELFVKG